jgi:3-hydroxyacyl-CoA dehydrogenase
MSRVSYALHGRVAVATVENPPVNALSHAVRSGLMDAIGRCVADLRAQALVIIGGGGTFIAGADINDFGKPYVEPTLYDIMDALMSCPKPVISAIHGTAFGGGFELALSCHWRVAVGSAQVGQPEVKLGLMPGGHGTQWWTRLAGPEVALSVCTSGDPVGAAQAFEWGVIDRIVDGELLDGALHFAAEVASGALPPRRLCDSADKIRDLDPELFADFRSKHQRKWKGLLAPWKIVDCIEAACRLDFAEGAKLERLAFQECERSYQSRALIHRFFAERAAGKVKDVGTAPAAPIRSAAVVGAGTMGSGIAMCFANAGIPVTLLDTSQDALSRGLATIRGNYATSVARGSITQMNADRALAWIRTTDSDADLGDADIIVEAVFEDLALKKAVFRRLDAVAKPGAVLATNTSTLDVDAIAAATSRPQSVVGLHFFSPANVMRLLEIVRGARSSPAAIGAALGLARTLRKIAVVAGNAEGFIGNRILDAYGTEADFLLEEGATPWQIDRVLVEFGFPMGLFAMRDMAGLDVFWRIRQQQRNSTQPRPGRRSPIADRIYEMGRLGQKTGRGYYVYRGREAIPDPEIESLIAGVSAELGFERRPIADEEILHRLLCAMVREGARILEEGIAQRAGDIDVVYVNGYGFPSYRGGPMWWAQEVGLARSHELVSA